jgi:hypothetical protein
MPSREREIQDYAILNKISQKEAKRRLRITGRYKHQNAPAPAKVAPAPVAASPIPAAQAAE